jgi:hypothetical protein
MNRQPTVRFPTFTYSFTFHLHLFRTSNTPSRYRTLINRPVQGPLSTLASVRGFLILYLNLSAVAGTHGCTIS